MNPKIGDRVMAIMSADRTTARSFGCGVYEGDHVPEEGQGGDFAREYKIPNPRIKLDSGKIVWGCECWWGPEEQVKEKFKDHVITEVDIEQARASASQTQEQD